MVVTDYRSWISECLFAENELVNTRSVFCKAHARQPHFFLSISFQVKYLLYCITSLFSKQGINEFPIVFTLIGIWRKHDDFK